MAADSHDGATSDCAVCGGEVGGAGVVGGGVGVGVNGVDVDVIDGDVGVDGGLVVLAAGGVVLVSGSVVGRVVVLGWCLVVIGRPGIVVVGCGTS